MGSYAKLFLLAGSISLGVIIIHEKIQSDNEKLMGYIAPETKRTLVWINDQYPFRYIPHRTVEVVLMNTGERVRATISNSGRTPYYILYSDYPDAEGRKIIVKLKEHDGEYIIVSGKIK